MVLIIFKNTFWFRRVGSYITHRKNENKITSSFVFDNLSLLSRVSNQFDESQTAHLLIISQTDYLFYVVFSLEEVKGVSDSVVCS